MPFPNLCYSKSTAAKISSICRSNRLYTIVSMAAISAEDDAQYGFERPEMFTADIANSIPPYGRHVFLCYKTPEVWNSHVEEQDLPKLLDSAIKARKSDIPVKTRLTICEGGESDGDVLIFPDLIKYKGLDDSNVESFVDDVLVNGKPWASSGIQEALTGSHVFVCAHASRDKRCGVCGPILIEKFNQEIESRKLSDQIFVRSCSHLGQHKYAGNLVIYSPDLAGKIMGHWYGYVSPDAVPELLDQHIAKGEIVQRIWRGQLGLPVEENTEVNESKQPNGSITKEDSGEKIAGGCCQGSSGVSCCREVPSEPAKPAEGKKRFEKLTSNLGSLGGNEYLIGASVAGLVASAAVAFSLYRRSG